MMVLIIGFHLIALILVVFTWITSRQIALLPQHKYMLKASAILFSVSGISTIFLNHQISLIYKMIMVLLYGLLVFGVVRGAKNKYHHKYFARNMCLDSLCISGLIITVWTLGISSVSFDIYLMAVFLLTGASLVGLIVTYAKLLARKSSGGMVDFPTVSVLVPARNEDHALQQCLSNLLKLDYPKLEIIVLDDCSQDRTPEIIASYARDGVRFVQGNQPEPGWTGKNHALQRLVEEASGEYLVFCDVDVRFSTSAVTELINYITRHKLDMVSVLPAHRHFDLMPSLFLLPYDQLTLLSSLMPRRLKLAARSCFVIKAEMLVPEGFLAHKNSVVPESLIAAKLNHQLLLGTNFEVTTRKRISSIFNTHIRLSYPLALKSVTFVGAKLLIATIFICVFVQALLGSVAAMVIVGICMLTHIVSMSAAGYKWPLLGLLGWLFTLFVKIILDVMSMSKYELGEVEWKSRNICYPILMTIPRLPKLEE